LAPAWIAACGGSSKDEQGGTQPVEEENWQPLLSGDWTLPQGTEGYTCVRQTVTEDLYVKAFDAINPLGTHHTLLTMGEPNAPDGVTLCNAGENRFLSAFGSGVGCIFRPAWRCGFRRERSCCSICTSSTLVRAISPAPPARGSRPCPLRK
jgi:hypothetical protein